MKALALPSALVGFSVGIGALISMIPPRASAAGITAAPVVGFASVAALLFVWALARLGRRSLATLLLYGSAATIAVPAIRVVAWMTVSDLFLMVAGLLLLPESAKLHLRSTVERRFAVGVLLIGVGGMLGVSAAEDTRLSVLNLLRLVVAAGAMLVVFSAWAPTPAELRRFLTLIVFSGVATAGWALTHMTAHFGRPSGLSGHPNHLALVALIAIGPALGLWLVPGSRRRTRVGAAAASGLLVAAIVVSGSRSGLLGLAVAVCVTAILVRRTAPRAQLVIAGAAVVAVAVLGTGLLNAENALGRTLGTNSSSVVESNRERSALLAQMIEEINREPITGVGFGDPLGGHGAYLQLWAAGGILAFLGGFMVIATACTAVGYAVKLESPTSIHASSWPLLASSISLSGLLVALTFQNLLWHRFIWITVALVGAAAAVAGSRRSVRSSS
jgi:O-Antigen ligase